MRSPAPIIRTSRPFFASAGVDLDGNRTNDYVPGTRKGDGNRMPMDEFLGFVNAFRAKPGRPAEKVFLSCGVYESLIYENRSMAPFLERAGMEVRFVESRDGHTWENWRDRLREGLSWLFPGPLWMIYE